MTRAERREHHRAAVRLARARLTWRGWSPEAIARWAPIYASSPRPCSCRLCERPRYSRARERWGVDGRP